MSDHDQDVQVEIQRTLVSINDVTIKIKNELMMITDLIREEGRLGTAVNDANDVLANVIKDLGIDITVDPTVAENEEQLDNLLVPASLDLITKTLLSITNENETQSQ